MSGAEPKKVEGRAAPDSRAGAGAEIPPLLEELARVLPDTLYSTLASGEVRYVGPAIEALTGHPPEDFLRDQHLWARLVVPEDLPIAQELMASLLIEGSPQEAVYRLRHAGSGRIRHVLDRAAPVREAGEHAIRIHGVLIDITDRVEVEMRLEVSEQLRGLGQLARDVAHDFNNLLVTILGHADLLLRSVDEGTAPAKALGRIISAAERGTTLTERLLAFARGSTTSDVQDEVRLGPLLQDVAAEVRTDLADALRLEVVVQGLPARVSGHSERIADSVLQLLHNAGEACAGDRGTAISLILRAGSAEEAERIEAPHAVVVEVVDDGPGMGAEVASRVFEPLFTTRGAEGGRGLGCAIAFSVAADHGGLLEVESGQGEGSTFRMILPALEPEQAAAQRPRKRSGRRRVDSSTVVVEREPDPDTPRILVVDDEPSVRGLLKDLLEGAGYHVRAVASGVEALAEVREHPERYVLVLLDVMMHPMDGTAVWARLRDLAPEVPVLFCTGHSDAERIARPEALEQEGVVAKPFRAAHLIQAVRAHAARAPASPGVGAS